MEQKHHFSRKLISLKEASKISGYHPDYLSSLIRKGEIKGERIGRNWFSTEEDIKDYLLRKKFFPLKDVLLSRISKKQLIVFICLIILSIIAIPFFLPSKVIVQNVAGDFSNDQLNIKNTNVAKITAYSSDSAGGVEISIQPNSDKFKHINAL